jgi:hypothetical protein
MLPGIKFSSAILSVRISYCEFSVGSGLLLRCGEEQQRPALLLLVQVTRNFWRDATVPNLPSVLQTRTLAKLTEHGYSQPRTI